MVTWPLETCSLAPKSKFKGLTSLHVTCIDKRGNNKRNAYFSSFPGAATSQKEQFGKVVDELKKDGAKVAAAGACWGYKVIVSADAALSAIAGFHPSYGRSFNWL